MWLLYLILASVLINIYYYFKVEKLSGEIFDLKKDVIYCRSAIRSLTNAIVDLKRDDNYIDHVVNMLDKAGE